MNVFIKQFLTSDVISFLHNLDNIKELVELIYIRNTGHSCSDPDCNFPLDPRLLCKSKRNIPKEVIKQKSGLYRDYIKFIEDKTEDKIEYNYINYLNLFNGSNYKIINKIVDFLDSNVNWFFKTINKDLDKLKRRGLINIYIENLEEMEWSSRINCLIIFVISQSTNKNNFVDLVTDFSR